MFPDRTIRNMMQGMGMGMPFGGLFGDMMDSSAASQFPGSAMMPHGFMSPMSMMMMDPFQNMQQAMSMASSGNGGGFSYCSSSVTSYTTDEHGRPQVYQQSNEVKQGPDGLRETKSAVRDTRTGRQELSIGHHLHEKAHIKKKSKNSRTGEEEQAEDFINLEEDEAEAFESNWMQQARNCTPAAYNQLQYGPSTGRSRTNRLAISSGTGEDKIGDPSSHRRSNSHSNGTSLIDRIAMKAKKKKKKSKDAES